MKKEGSACNTSLLTKIGFNIFVNKNIQIYEKNCRTGMFVL